MDESWYNPIFEHDIPALKKRLEEQDLVCQEEILLFCHGHSVLEKFITPFIKRVVEILKNLNIEEARQTLNEATDGVVEDTIKRIENQAKQNLETKLNDGFKCLIYDKNYPSQQIQKIREKMQNELVVCQDCFEGLQTAKTT